MKRSPTALRAIGGFGVTVAILSVAATAAVVVLAPEPIQRQMTGAEAVAALRGESATLNRRFGSPPEGTRDPMLESLLAAEFGRPNEDVRVVSLQGNNERPRKATFRLKADQLLQGRETKPRSMVFVGRRDGSFEMVDSDEADGLVRFSLLNLPMPAFTAAIRENDERWLIVSPIQPFLTIWQRNVLIALAISLLLLAPLAWFFARRLTRPFRALSNALNDTSGPIPHEGPQELREAANAIASMRTKLTAEAAERARILTAIAHDLRTPLTGLRLRAEHVEEPRRTRMIDDIERMREMIDEVLGFARDAAVPVERLDVRPFVESILADMNVSEHSMILLPAERALVEVPPLAFRRVIENLIRNAIDYAEAGTVAVRHDGPDVVVEISDSGPGIAERDRDRLLRPFERGESSRSRQTGGTGLGLSIVREFALRCRGEFELKDAPGGGTVAELRLPKVSRAH